MTVIAKFGGTSVADYQVMGRCAEIVLNNPATRVVVVSASSGVTNLLVELTQANLTDERRLQLLKAIASIQYGILDCLVRPAEVASELDKLLSQMLVLSDTLVLNRGKHLMDALLSTGEQCSSLLFA
ncbi:MAG: lysine-sensitive aspartokinase 3, partial [Shewanella sp.]|nr:lysine-sensitive aspartokinase 3 [Shewanella sp.]